MPAGVELVEKVLTGEGTLEVGAVSMPEIVGGPYIDYWWIGRMYTSYTELYEALQHLCRPEACVQ